MQGRIAFNAERPFQAGLHRLTIRTGNLPAGIYLLELSANGRKVVAKIANVK